MCSVLIIPCPAASKMGINILAAASLVCKSHALESSFVPECLSLSYVLSRRSRCQVASQVYIRVHLYNEPAFLDAQDMLELEYICDVIKLSNIHQVAP